MFDNSKKLTKFIERTTSAIKDINPDDSPYLSFRYENALYKELVVELYAHFLKCIIPHMQLVWENLKAVLDNHKECIGRIENTMFVA